MRSDHRRRTRADTAEIPHHEPHRRRPAKSPWAPGYGDESHPPQSKVDFPFVSLGKNFSHEENNKFKARQTAWQLLAKSSGHFDTRQQNNSPTWIAFNSPLFKGKRTNYRNFPELLKILQSNKKYHHRDKKVLTQQYKIHLMPTFQELPTTIMQLFKLIQANPKLQKSIYQIKCNVLETDLHTQEHIVPRIVIYPADGKQHAQQALDSIYNAFKKKKGTNETPRFNQKVTSLIYFAQGSGNTKLQLSDDYFEADKKIYFDSNLTPSGVGGGYHLAIPAES